MMKNLFKKNSILIVLLADILILTGVFFLAHLIRFDFKLPSEFRSTDVDIMISVVVFKLIVFSMFKLYRGMWRFTSIIDLFNVLKAATLSSIFIVVLLLFLNRFDGLSRSVFVIDWFLTVLFVSGFRIMVRIYFEGRFRIWASQIFPFLFKGTRDSFWKPRKRLLIIGAGNSGEKIFREIKDNVGLDYRVVGFIDDHPVKLGKYIHGKKIFGAVSDLTDIAKQTNAEERFIRFINE